MVRESACQGIKRLHVIFGWFGLFRLEILETA